MFKRVILWLFVAVPFSVFADDCPVDGSCRLPVKFTGYYLENTCEVSINNNSMAEVIQLPVISHQRLASDGDEAGSQTFSVTLKTCPLSHKVALRFLPANISADAETGNVKNSVGDGYSKNVQIRLRNEDGVQMRLNDANSLQEYLIPDTGEDVTHHFIASYYAKGTAAVTAGKIHTLAAIEVVYK
ncbi:type 1 fimbrial protein [Enterobacteriaceae bacterium 4M9]|nr:type 1 fimbrial protein [Enterobacteriaceae bacterium 4M9]